MSSSNKRDSRVHTFAFVLLAATLSSAWYAIWFSITGEHPRYEPARWWNFNGAYVLKSYILMTVAWAVMFSYSVNPDNKTSHKYGELIARTLLALCVGAFLSLLGEARAWHYFIGLCLIGAGSGVANYRFRTGTLWIGTFSLAAGFAFGPLSFLITLAAGYAIMLLTDTTMDEAKNRDTVIG